MDVSVTGISSWYLSWTIIIIIIVNIIIIPGPTQPRIQWVPWIFPGRTAVGTSCWPLPSI